MTYRVEIAKPAQRQLKKLDAPIRRKLSRRIDRLANDPRPAGVAKLTDVSPPIFRVREGQYRILYTIEDDRLVVVVVRIGHRGEVYRRI
jgi:mRNA interferase RelE/StbE